jgi:hypothetical protein
MDRHIIMNDKHNFVILFFSAIFILISISSGYIVIYSNMFIAGYTKNNLFNQTYKNINSIPELEISYIISKAIGATHTTISYDYKINELVVNDNKRFVVQPNDVNQLSQLIIDNHILQLTKTDYRVSNCCDLPTNNLSIILNGNSHTFLWTGTPTGINYLEHTVIDVSKIANQIEVLCNKLNGKPCE